MKKDCVKCSESFDTKTSTKICNNCKLNIKCKINNCHNKVKYYDVELCQKHYMLNFRNKDEEGYERKFCQICNKEYKPKCPTQMFCSKECSQIRRKEKSNLRRRKPLINKNCKICDKKFSTSRKFQNTCSNECKKENNLLRKRNYYRNILKPKYGYLNRGESFPQFFIFNVICKYFNNLKWNYNCRDVLINPNTNYPMEIDIWCPNLRLAIEFDGQQHFEPKYGNEVFQYTKKMDSLKNKLCKEVGIKLLRIAYKDDWENKEWVIKKIKELINGDC